MNSELRQIEVYDAIKKDREITVASLAERFGVSSMTIRRVLDRLEQAKLVERTYGKVRVIDTSKIETSFNERRTANLPGKQKMAEIAINFLLSRKVKSVYLDGSTSALELAKALPQSLPLTVFSNSIPLAQVLQYKPWIRTFIIGGFLDCDSFALSDISTEDQCKQIFVDATFTSCGGFSAMGMFNNGFTGAQIRRIMMKNSTVNYLLADHTKFNTQGVFLLYAWDLIDVLITDKPLPESFMQMLASQDVSVFSEMP